MIFVSVGSQMPFDRLIGAVDEWAGARGRCDVFAQVGPTDLRPRHIEWAPFIEPAEFRERVRACSAMVAHAGMGSILTAMEFGKPILVMPRRGALMETRNDHQVATARRFLALGRIRVAMDESELPGLLDDLVAGSGVGVSAGTIGRHASAELLAAVRAFIHGLPIPGLRGTEPAAGQEVEPKAPAEPVEVPTRAQAEAQVKPPLGTPGVPQDASSSEPMAGRA